MPEVVVGFWCLRSCIIVNQNYWFNIDDDHNEKHWLCLNEIADCTYSYNNSSVHSKKCINVWIMEKYYYAVEEIRPSMFKVDQWWLQPRLKSFLMGFHYYLNQLFVDDQYTSWDQMIPVLWRTAIYKSQYPSRRLIMLSSTIFQSFSMLTMIDHTFLSKTIVDCRDSYNEPFFICFLIDLYRYFYNNHDIWTSRKITNKWIPQFVMTLKFWCTFKLKVHNDGKLIQQLQ
jgi:hypothetical protein